LSPAGILVPFPTQSLVSRQLTQRGFGTSPGLQLHVALSESQILSVVALSHVRLYGAKPVLTVHENGLQIH
tara:strand:- start:40 stop:252 length:213 start_codon:yes stop_codon:yes gene_type:complete